MKNYILYIVLSLLLVGLVDISNAQQQTFDPANIVIPPSPTATSVAKFGDVPVGLYTSVPNVSVPLYSFSSRTLSVPINMSYHASGIKVDEVAGWTGLGWALSANYVISRSIRGGYADEDGLGYQNNPIMADFDGGILDVYEHPAIVGAMARGERDGEPDLYHFSFPGGSGSFVYDHSGEVHIQPYQDTKILKGVNGNEFTIVSADGTLYHYNAVEETEVISVNCEGPMTGTIPEETAWYLTRIEDVNGMDEITFSYEPYEINYLSSVSATIYFDNYGAPNGCDAAPSPQECINKFRTKGQRLVSISSPYTGIIEFEASSGRDDLNGGQQLDRISIKNNGSLIKQFDLEYD